MAELQFDTVQRPKRISIEEIVNVRSRRPTATSRDRGWGGVTIDAYRPHPNCGGSFDGLDHHAICYCPTGSAKMVQGRAGSVHRGVFSAGMSLVIPAGYESLWDGDAAASVRLRIPTDFLATAGDELGRRSAAQIEVRSVFETRDSLFEHMALTLMGELERKPHPAQALIVDCVSTALAAHLLRSYNGFDPVETYQAPAMGQSQLALLTAYIEDNLGRSIGLAELAALANVSRFHFARMFKRSTGVTAMRYVEQRRIRRAQSLIVETDISLAEVALMTGFADQSHFTRRFRRQVGCTPAAFARESASRRARTAPWPASA